MSDSNIFSKLTLKDIVQMGIIVFSFAGFYFSTTSELKAVAARLSEIKEDRSETKIWQQNLQNQVNSNTMQIELLKKEIEYIKGRP